MKKPNPFTKPDTKKNEAAERKMAGSKANYAKMEKKFEGKACPGCKNPKCKGGMSCQAKK